MRHTLRRDGWTHARHRSSCGSRGSARNWRRCCIRNRGSRPEAPGRRRRPEAYRAESCVSYAAPLPRLHDALRGAVRRRHDGERRVEPTVGHVHAAIDHVEIVEIVDAAVLVHYTRPRVVTHAARARLMLPSASALPGELRPGADGARLL